MDAFGAGAARRPAGDIDLVLALDTSASMAGELARIKARMAQILDRAAGRANTVRFAMVSFREDPPWSGDPIRPQLDASRLWRPKLRVGVSTHLVRLSASVYGSRLALSA